MRQLEEEVRAIRLSEPELSGVVHPKTERKSVERKMDKSWRAHKELKRDADSRVVAVVRARTRVAETQEKYRLAESAHGKAVDNCERLRKQYGTRKPLLDGLRADIDRLRETEADPEEIADRQRQFATEKSAVDKISENLKSAERDQNAAERVLSDAQRELDARNDLLNEAESDHASAQREADAAGDSYAKHQKLYLSVKKLESLLIWMNLLL